MGSAEVVSDGRRSLLTSAARRTRPVRDRSSAGAVAVDVSPREAARPAACADEHVHPGPAVVGLSAGCCVSIVEHASRSITSPASLGSASLVNLSCEGCALCARFGGVGYDFGICLWRKGLAAEKWGIEASRTLPGKVRDPDALLFGPVIYEMMEAGR